MKGKTILGLLMIIAGALSSCAPVTVNVDVPSEPVAAGSTATAYVTLTCSGGDSATLLDVRVSSLTEGLTASPSSKTISDTEFSGTSVTTTYQLTASSAQNYTFKILGTIEGEATPIDSTHSVTFTNPSSVFTVSYTLNPTGTYNVNDNITVNSQITYLGSGSTLAPVEFNTGTNIAQQTGTFEYPLYNFSNSTPTANFQWVVQPTTDNPSTSYITVSGYENDVLELENVIDPTPSITLLSPAAGASTTDTTPSFRFKVNDSDNTTVSCTLYIDGNSKATGNATADGSTVRTFTPSALSESSHNWYINCTDGTNSDRAPSSGTRTLTISSDDGNGGNGGSSGGGGGIAGDTPPPGEEFKKQYETKKNMTYFQQLINQNQNIQNALKNALGKKGLTEEDINKIANISARISQHHSFTTNANHTQGGAASRLELKFNYNGTNTLKNAVILFTVPKSFATNASQITITTTPQIPSEKIIIIQEDPVYSFELSEVSQGEILEVFFDVNAYINRNTVNEDIETPMLLADEIVEPEPEPTQTCGNGIKEGSEECDGTDGIKKGYECGSDCLLRKTPEETPTPPEEPETQPEPTPQPNQTKPPEETDQSWIIVVVIAIILVILVAIGAPLMKSKMKPKEKKKKDRIRL